MGKPYDEAARPPRSRPARYRLPEPIELSAQAGDSGRNGHRVVYQADGYGTRHQADVTVSGGRKISGWTRVKGSGGMWRAGVGSLDRVIFLVEVDHAWAEAF
jgi:hypothetical protein